MDKNERKIKSLQNILARCKYANCCVLCKEKQECKKKKNLSKKIKELSNKEDDINDNN